MGRRRRGQGLARSLLDARGVLGRSRRGGLLGAVASLALAAAPAGSGAPAERLEWRRLPAGAQGEGVAALAIDPSSGALAVGDARGVWLVDRAGGFRRALQRGPVHDLAFLPPVFPPEGAMLAATEVGLYRVEADGRVAQLAPAPGQDARRVHRIAVSSAAVALASQAGAFLSGDARRWQRLSRALPARPASAVALRARDSGLECFAVVDGRLWRVRVARTGDGWVAASSIRETIPFSRGDSGPVDVVFGLGGADIVVVFPAGFATRAGDDEPWRLISPALPPGASARRLVAAHGRLWLATDRGLLVAEKLAGPWRRAAGLAGRAQVRAVASDAASLFVGADDQVLAAEPAGGRVGAPSEAERAISALEGDPAIARVHRVALRYLELEPARIAALRAGVARRGWFPILTLRAAYAGDEDYSTDRDQAFLSGEMRHLVDRERQRARDFEVSAMLSWDFGEVAYHPEQIDVSREAREVVKLRDDVLDELTQLYFERRRVLAELAARPDAPPAEALRLRLRAAELAAGIDAWTGGWFGEARSAAGP